MTTEREIEELLPAYVNGTATAEERAAVERALAEEPALVEEKRFLESLGERLGQQAANSPGEMGWHRLRRDIRQPAPVRTPRTGWWRQAVAAAAAIVIVVQGGLLWQTGEDAGGYQPLGSEVRAELQLRFVPSASAAEIAALLAAENLEIVSGPGAAGIYRLDVVDDDADVDALVERLAGHDDVVAFVARE